MKNLLILIFSGLSFTAYAQTASIVIEDGQYQLEIPYVEIEGEDGEDQAFSMTLTAPIDANPKFSVDFSSLEETVIGDRPSIDGDNVCLETAQGSLLACRFETRLDYSIDSVRCLNSADEECADDVEEAFEEEMEECEAIDEARIELCEILGGGPYIRDLDPEDFINPLNITSESANPYFPLIQGTVWVYESGDEQVVVTVTNETVEILGITALVVRDTVTEDGILVEDTDDWFAQDRDGNVWYMGELSKNYEVDEETGQIWFDDIEGSWRAGDEAAQPGILVYGNPEDHIGETYRQEFLAGAAEDFARVVAVDASVDNEDYPCDGNCLQTYENSPFEPVGFDDNTPETKLYLPGVGIIRAFHHDPETGELAEDEEYEELISFTQGTGPTFFGQSFAP